MIPEGITFTVCWAILPNGSKPVEEYLEYLLGTDRQCFASVLTAIGQLRASEHLRSGTRPLKGKALSGIFELKVRAGINRHYARLPLILTKEREVVILFGETKKGEKPTVQFLKRAQRMRKQVNEKEATYEQIDENLFD